MKNIVLIGMPGSGKSTVGVVLAKAMGMQFIDTDLLIQQKTGETLQTTINTKGLEAFLKVEEDVLSSIEVNSFVIATGGSAVLSQNAMEHLKKNSILVFLNVTLSELKNRISNITTRGIAMKKGEDIATVYETRLPLYKKYSNITVSPDTLTLEQTVEEIFMQLKDY